MNFHIREFRLFPISSWRCPTEEYAKMCILNGIENHIAYCELGDDRSYWELYRDTLFLFQYGGQIIAKAKAHMICVCSNCHRMLHRNRWNVISPEELIEILQMRI